MTTQLLGLSGILCVMLYSSCGQHAITLQYRIVDEYSFSRAELAAIQAIADDTTHEVRRLLPGLPNALVLEVFPADDVIEELGYTGEEMNRTVYWAVNPHYGEGVAPIAEAHLRAFLFQSFLSLVRYQSVEDWSRPERVINAGLRTVFARDFAGTTDPWTDYPPEVSDWVTEVMAGPVNAQTNPWRSRQPDGRRWIGIKAGTYLVELAIQASGKSVVDLVSTPADEIIRMAQAAHP